MADVENKLNDDEFFGDTVDTQKKGVEQDTKRECLKSVIGRGKVCYFREKMDTLKGRQG